MAAGDARGEAPLDTIFDDVAVTPNDSTDLPEGPCRALWIVGTGTLRITNRAGRVVNYAAAELKLAPDIFPFGAKRVHSTGTTATGIRALY